MSARIKRLGLMGVLALAPLSVYACGDDDDDDDTPGDGDGDGDRDSGAGDGDAGGPGMDASAALSCGEGDQAVSCQSVEVLPGTALPACCTEENNACGLDTTLVSNVTQGLFPPGCLERNQPYAPPNHKRSEFCTNYWEQLDPDEATPPSPANGFTVTVATQTVSFEGCCRLQDGKGECGFAADTVLGAELGFGCLPLDTFKNAFTAADGGQDQFNQVKAAAVCDPTTGEQVTGGDAGAGDAGAGDAGTGDAGAGDSGTGDAAP